MSAVWPFSGWHGSPKLTGSRPSASRFRGSAAGYAGDSAVPIAGRRKPRDWYPDYGRPIQRPIVFSEMLFAGGRCRANRTDKRRDIQPKLTTTQFPEMQQIYLGGYPNVRERQENQGSSKTAQGSSQESRYSNDAQRIPFIFRYPAHFAGRSCPARAPLLGGTRRPARKRHGRLVPGGAGTPRAGFVTAAPPLNPIYLQRFFRFSPSKWAQSCGFSGLQACSE